MCFSMSDFVLVWPDRASSQQWHAAPSRAYFHSFIQYSLQLLFDIFKPVEFSVYFVTIDLFAWFDLFAFWFCFTFSCTIIAALLHC